MFVQFLGFIIVDFVIIVFVVAVAFSNTDTDSNTAIISVFEWRFMLPIPFFSRTIDTAATTTPTYTTKSTFV